MTNKRYNITQPEDWMEAWKAQAAKEGLSLSAWIGKQCNEGLTKKAKKSLSDRAPAHRPAHRPAIENTKCTNRKSKIT